MQRHADPRQGVVQLLSREIVYAPVVEIRTLRMGEKNRPADIQVSPHLIQIAGVELHLFADVVGRLVETPRLIAYAQNSSGFEPNDTS